MKSENIIYEDGGTTCIGFLVDPEVGPSRPGILIAHEGPGLNDHMRAKARLVAALGYVAFAVDLYGSGHVAKSPDETMALMAPLRENVSKLRARVGSGLEALSVQPNVNPRTLGSIGYCFGGMAVLELARSGAPVDATVCFHGILHTKVPQDAKNIRGRILACTGSDDPFAPSDQVIAFQQEMSEAGVDWQVNIYGGAKHAFTNPNADAVGRPGLAYHRTADVRSWDAMRAFFKDAFGTA